VGLARERGIRCRVYRLPILAGHSRTGAVAVRQYWFTQTLRAAWLLGKLPYWPEPIQAVPVDYAAAAILRISCQQSLPTHAFHLTHPVGVSVGAVESAFARLGRRLSTLPIGEWTSLVEAFAVESRDEQLEYLASFLSGSNAAQRATQAAERALQFDRTGTQEALHADADDLAAPEEMVGTTLGFLRRQGWLS
jgi:thioester reductase-like protein